MNDRQMDELVSQALEREDMLKDLQKGVMKELAHERRRSTARQWLRIIAFSFGLPAILLSGVGGLVMVAMQMDGIAGRLPVIAAAAIFASSMVVMANRWSENFSFDGM